MADNERLISYDIPQITAYLNVIDVFTLEAPTQRSSTVYPGVLTGRCLPLTILGLFITIYTVQAQYKPFNCRRSGTSCLNSFPCRLDGTCGCDADPAFTGDDCGLATGTLAPQMCPGRACQNGGSCYFDGTTSVPVSKCYCTAGFYGSMCEKYRVSIECTNGSMNAFVNPYTNSEFKGAIYVYKLSGDPNCRFQATTTPGYEGYELTLPLQGNGACSTERIETNDNGNRIFEYQIFVRYDQLITSFVDERHVLQCEFTLNGRLTASTSTGFDDTGFQQLTGTNTRRGYQPVSLLIKKTGTDVVVATAVELGDSLYLEFELPANELIYVSYKVDSCTAYSTLGNKTQIAQEYPLLANGCPHPDAGSVETISADGRITKMTFRAFKFDFTSIVNFACQITLCEANTTNLCTVDYTCPTNSNGRRRRQTVTQYLKTDVIGQILVVMDSPASPVVAATDVECNLIYFYVVLAVLAFFALLSLICAIYLCFKMVRRRKRFHTLVIRNETLPNGEVVQRIEKVYPPTDDSGSGYREPIVNKTV